MSRIGGHIEEGRSGSGNVSGENYSQLFLLTVSQEGCCHYKIEIMFEIIK